MRCTLAREHWRVVYSSLDGSASTLRESIKLAGMESTRTEFAVDGSYFDFAEVVHLMRGTTLAHVIAEKLALSLWSEIQDILRKEDSHVVREQAPDGSAVPQ